MKLQTLAFILSNSLLISCSNDPNGNSTNSHSNVDRIENKYYDSKGIGPVKELILSNDLDESMVKAGEQLYNSKCTSCHKLSAEKGIGPGLAGISERRRPEWIMNMILNPMEMTQKDSLAKELLAIYYSQMLDNNLTEQEARSILEFLRGK